MKRMLVIKFILFVLKCKIANHFYKDILYSLLRDGISMYFLSVSLSKNSLAWLEKVQEKTHLYGFLKFTKKFFDLVLHHVPFPIDSFNLSQSNDAQERSSRSTGFRRIVSNSLTKRKSSSQGI